MLILGTVYTSSCLSGLSARKYDKDWIIGKTSSEVEERYGKFDLCLNHKNNENGNYYSTGCGYMTKQHKSTATMYDEFFMIYFDENGIAYKFKENYPRPGG